MKYLTKGELLQTLGSSSDRFTMFLMNPEVFGITEPMLTKIKVAKQKFDWTNSIDLNDPEVIELIQLLSSYGIVDKIDADRVLNTVDRADGDLFIVTIRAQDDITATNIYGIAHDGNAWVLRVEFKNNSTGEIVERFESFDVAPTEDMVNTYISNTVKELKRV